MTLSNLSSDVCRKQTVSEKDKRNMSRHILSTNEEDLFEYAFITSDTLEAGVDVIRKSLFVHENVCIAVELQRDPNAVKELEELCVRTAKDGVSLIAIDKKSKQVVGASFNKLQVKSSNEALFFEEFASKCKRPSSKALVQFMIDADSAVDLFELCKVNCLLEVMFVGVLSDYRGNRIASKLSELSINIAKDLSSGKNIKVPINNEILSLKPIPRAVSAICTSNISQAIALRQNFSLAADLSYAKFVFEGETFATRIGRIGRIGPSAQVVYKVL